MRSEMKSNRHTHRDRETDPTTVYTLAAHHTHSRVYKNKELNIQTGGAGKQIDGRRV